MLRISVTCGPLAPGPARTSSVAPGGMLPWPLRSFPGYRLLQEYFSFPDKYFFFDVGGLSEALARGFKNRFELIFLLSPFELSERRQVLELGVSTRTFRINTTPIVNLFAQTAEPILLEIQQRDQEILEYLSRNVEESLAN